MQTKLNTGKCTTEYHSINLRQQVPLFSQFLRLLARKWGGIILPVPTHTRQCRKAKHRIKYAEKQQLSSENATNYSVLKSINKSSKCCFNDVYIVINMHHWLCTLQSISHKLTAPPYYFLFKNCEHEKLFISNKWRWKVDVTNIRTLLYSMQWQNFFKV